MKHRINLFCVIISALFIGAVGPAWSQSSPESIDPTTARALYILNLVKSITWPESVQIDTLPNLNVCVIGDTSDLNEQQYRIRTDTPKLKVVSVEKNSKSLTTNCHVIYFSDSEGASMESVFNRIKGLPILTIGSPSKFASKGGMFGLVMIDEKMRFTVNRAALSDADLKIRNANVLALAVVEP